MQTILITGASGFLGWNLARRLRFQYRVYGTYLDHQVFQDQVECIAFDLTNLDKIDKLCSTLRPSAIVHTAALSDPDYCEAHHKEALTLNTFATRELAKCTLRLGGKLIYLSTDLVFDGASSMYSEADPPSPLSYYAKTKYLGELEIMNNCSSYVTLRLSGLYGRGNGHKRNFFEQMEHAARRNSKMQLFVDQYRTPLFVEDAALAVERFIADRSLKGLFHLGGPERMSRFEFGQVFCRVFDFSPSLMVPVHLEDAKLAAPRPKDCSLKSDKARKLLKLSLTPAEEGLGQLLRSRA